MTLPTMDLDLLTEPLLEWRDGDRRRSLATLPGILAALGTGKLGDFPQVRPHQLDAWNMFLTQLAAIALQGGGSMDSRLSEEEWRELLLRLTEGADEPWCLIVDDLSKPGFFQPPVPEGSVHAWSRYTHPDDLDILVTSKNHDVKTSLVVGDAELWIYALVSLQTMQGYSGGGGGYNRVSRMKGGYGSRPRVGVAPNLSLASRFARDVDVLLASWEFLIDRGFTSDGISLVWTAPWDGASCLAMPQLSPHFIEICRRLRFLGGRDTIACAYTTTQSRRCLSEIVGGDVGDSWIPIDAEGGALTVGGGGFRYQLMTRILFDSEFVPAAAQRLQEGDGDPVLLLASVLARGQGKTEGLHNRTLPLVGRARKLLGRADTRAVLGVRASENVNMAKVMRSKVLFPALKALALGETVVEDDFDAHVDVVFFIDLFAAIDEPDAEARLAWTRQLFEIAWAEIQRAIERCCLPSARWYRAVSHAEGMFHSCLHKQFPDFASTFHPGAA